METGGSAFCHPYTGEEDEWYEAREIALICDGFDAPINTEHTSSGSGYQVQNWADQVLQQKLIKNKNIRIIPIESKWSAPSD